MAQFAGNDGLYITVLNLKLNYLHGHKKFLKGTGNHPKMLLIREPPVHMFSEVGMSQREDSEGWAMYSQVPPHSTILQTEEGILLQWKVLHRETEGLGNGISLLRIITNNTTLRLKKKSYHVVHLTFQFVILLLFWNTLGTICRPLVAFLKYKHRVYFEGR